MIYRTRINNICTVQLMVAAQAAFTQLRSSLASCRPLHTSVKRLKSHAHTFSTVRKLHFCLNSKFFCYSPCQTFARFAPCFVECYLEFWKHLGIVNQMFIKAQILYSVPWQAWLPLRTNFLLEPSIFCIHASYARKKSLLTPVPVLTSTVGTAQLPARAFRRRGRVYCCYSRLAVIKTRRGKKREDSRW